MSDRMSQLREKDVRDTVGAAQLDPISFLSLYLASNFPQTASLPSKRQLETGITPNISAGSVDFSKPRSGTSFDNPAAS